MWRGLPTALRIGDLPSRALCPAGGGGGGPSETTRVRGDVSHFTVDEDIGTHTHYPTPSFRAFESDPIRQRHPSGTTTSWSNNLQGATTSFKEQQPPGPTAFSADIIIHQEQQPRPHTRRYDFFVFFVAIMLRGSLPYRANTSLLKPSNSLLLALFCFSLQAGRERFTCMPQ